MFVITIGKRFNRSQTASQLTGLQATRFTFTKGTVFLDKTYGTAQRQLDTRMRSTGRAPAVKISSARYVHPGTRKGFARHEQQASVTCACIVYLHAHACKISDACKLLCGSCIRTYFE